jgi:serine/threonine protein kinase
MSGNCSRFDRASATERMMAMYGGVRGLAHIHGRGIFHRAVNPSHIFIDSRGCPRLGGLDYAKLQDNAEQTLSLSQNVYRAPEVEETGKWGFPSDVYSFGITCFALITGQEWKPGKRDRHPNVKALTDAGAPKELADLVEAMWAEGAESRPLCPDIVSLLEKEEYWLPNVNGEEFRRYVEWVEREAARDRDDLKAEWVGSLRHATSARKMATAVADEPTVVGKVVKALGLLCPKRAGELRERVSKSIEEEGSIVSELVNAGAGVALDAEEDETLAPGQEYQVRVVKGDQLLEMILRRPEEGTVGQLYEKLDAFFGPGVVIKNRRTVLARDSPQKLIESVVQGTILQIVIGE